MMIESVRLYRLAVPLTHPYYTKFGNFREFDVTLAVIQSASGAGAGESLAVSGYSWEGPDDVWNYCLRTAPALPGREAEEMLTSLQAEARNRPFSVSPLLTALETLFMERTTGASATFPLAGILNIKDENRLEEGVKSLLQQGFTTIKFKVGYNVEDDLRKVAIIQKAAAGRALLRLDANQGYSFDDALTFVRGVDPAGIELLEQPFAADDWKSMETFAPLSPVPLMLDESIYHDEDILRAAACGHIRFIKLKLMKCGSMAALIRSGHLVRKNGLELVIGNGVATDLSCLHEVMACLALNITAAGEMNGFLKLRQPLLPGLLGFEKGCAVLASAPMPVPDKELLESLAIDKASFC